MVSDEPQNLGDPGAEPLWLGWYAGPRRDDGRPNRRVQLHRSGADGVVDLSVDEFDNLRTQPLRDGLKECGEAEPEGFYGLSCELAAGHPGPHYTSVTWNE